ncbi:class A beta-lactamase [Frateuria sp. STR12]|uniref:class A beta-lactamase n=1 Tax=Frateuria hangzhouensis TaxID=2995589 RepID=UPI0022609D7C|nr:class A beta-lactamase [Frateuria sp. STR12]MCX7514645.1 class A beta-lactamase [Frateuria sp. STR12]
MKRRDFIKGSLLGALLPASLAKAAASTAREADPVRRLAALEQRHGGRLGVAILDTGDGGRVAHRGSERFLMCSTFKVLAVAAVLARVDRGDESLERRVVFGRDVLLSYAPVTRLRTGAPGMRLEELCAAAITVSDNTAANLLLAALGGPTAVTGFVRGLGDQVTRLDRIEPDLNVTHPGDLRDTTSPDAALDTLHRLLLGNALSPASRARLLDWMRGCLTGTDKLRAGLPPLWSAGDKTGSGAQGESNDVAIVFPPDRAPLLVTAYYAAPDVDARVRSEVLAAVGRIAAAS